MGESEAGTGATDADRTGALKTNTDKPFSGLYGILTHQPFSEKKATAYSPPPPWGVGG